MIPRHEVEAIGLKHHVGQKFRKINHWSHFLVMLVAQISGAGSLREAVSGFLSNSQYYYHLGCKGISRSTLSRANSQQPWEIFRELYFLLAKRAPLRGKHKFDFPNKLISMDATTISLCHSCFTWAKHRRKKAGIKLHIGLDHSTEIPAFVDMTNAKEHDSKNARTITLESSAIYVMDRAYFDYILFNRMEQSGSGFVTRMKRNTKYRVISRNSVVSDSGVTSDANIQLTGTQTRNCTAPLRRIGYRDPETGKHYVFITNITSLDAATIAGIYKDRWKIELFFKWVKQNLRIKKFFGQTENAVLTQVWIAMITYLLCQILKALCILGTQLLDISRRLKYTLFHRVELLDALHCRHREPILQTNENQMFIW